VAVQLTLTGVAEGGEGLSGNHFDCPLHFRHSRMSGAPVAFRPWIGPGIGDELGSRTSRAPAITENSTKEVLWKEVLCTGGD